MLSFYFYRSSISVINQSSPIRDEKQLFLALSEKKMKRIIFIICSLIHCIHSVSMTAITYMNVNVLVQPSQTRMHLSVSDAATFFKLKQMIRQEMVHKQRENILMNADQMKLQINYGGRLSLTEPFDDDKLRDIIQNNQEIVVTNKYTEIHIATLNGRININTAFKIGGYESIDSTKTVHNIKDDVAAHLKQNNIYINWMQDSLLWNGKVLKQDDMSFSTVTNSAPIVELEICRKSTSQQQLPPGITSTKHLPVKQISGQETESNVAKPQQNEDRKTDPKEKKICGINRKVFIVIVILSLIIVLIAILMCVVCCR